MSKYHVYLTAHEGEGVPQALQDWDSDESDLTLCLSAFAKDATISIQQFTKQEYES